MDYLNPKMRRRHTVRLYIGYVLVTIAVILAVVIMFFLVRGFSYQDGAIVRDGMIYLNSTPSSASFTVNGTANGTTNKRLIVASGKYDIQINKAGYRPWQRTINLEGGAVQRYDYPLLIPNQLTSSSVLKISGQPGLASESPNNRWLLISEPSDLRKFKIVDLNSRGNPVVTNYTLPADLISTSGDASASWHNVAWSNDNQHVLLRYDFGKASDFIVIDRTNPAKSVNLDAAFGQNLTNVSFYNDNYDEYWFFNPTSRVLSRANLSDSSVKPYLNDVLAYKAYSDNVVLYATSSDAAPGRAHVLWYQNSESYPIDLNLPYSKNPADYLLDLAQYKSRMYVAVGEKSANKVTIYRDPLDQLASHPNQLSALKILSVKSPSYLKFSANAQFILAESGRQIRVFNAQYDTAYSYEIDRLDSPEKHLLWMDGYHLLHVGGGQLQLTDFNDLNPQTLVAASASYQPFLDPSGEYLLTLAVGTSGNTNLNITPLRLAADL